MEDIRWHQRLSNYQKALQKLNDNISFIKEQFNHIDFSNEDEVRNVGLAINDIYKQGLIQSFEFTHELAWNVMKDFAEDQGSTNIRGSKDATRYAARVNLITNAHLWMQMIQNRNKTTHTYHEETANEIFFEIISDYTLAFTLFEKTMLELKDGRPEHVNL
ncbi:MAG TPA: nucleotidyltransferase substrate binding protein [Flavipsychrobacter sp.]|nr:nucleotidyltransferase substrate binding protein [Flavipsychrobacter sp.]